jgi:hypothetical protein
MNPEQTTDAPGLGDSIDLSDEVEVERWAKVFRLTPEQLRRVVEVAGPDYGDLVTFFAESY